MYCKDCGKEIDDKTAICVHCGAPTGNSAYTLGKETHGLIIVYGQFDYFGKKFRFNFIYSRNLMKNNICLVCLLNKKC